MSCAVFPLGAGQKNWHWAIFLFPQRVISNLPAEETWKKNQTSEMDFFFSLKQCLFILSKRKHRWWEPAWWQSISRLMCGSAHVTSRLLERGFFEVRTRLEPGCLYPHPGTGPGQRLNRSSFYFYTHNTMEVLSARVGSIVKFQKRKNW